MIIRYSVSTILGVAVTFGLFFVMQSLIATGKGAYTDSRSFQIVDFVRIEREEIVEARTDKPEKPPEPEVRPDIPRIDSLEDSFDSLKVSVSSPRIDVRRNIGAGGVGFDVGDGDFLPIFKVAAIYPIRAAHRNLEGYVILEFTVTRAGSVKDVVVLESTSPIFEDSAVAAAYKYKYKPRVVDGEPVEVRGVVNQITFEVVA
jgi:protein TonB